MENGYRRPSVTIQIGKQMRKLKQNTGVSETRNRCRNSNRRVNCSHSGYISYSPSTSTTINFSSSRRFRDLGVLGVYPDPDPVADLDLPMPGQEEE